MGIGSLIAGIAALLFVLGGLVLAWLPGVGTVLSFGAPLLALAAIVTGGVAVTRANREGVSNGVGVAGIVVGAVALLPAIVVALTCGMCNACVTAGMFVPRDGSAVRWDMDASMHVPGTKGAPSRAATGAGRAGDGGTRVPPPGAWADEPGEAGKSSSSAGR